MTLIFYAQPYDISVEGFYFRSVEEYDRQVLTIKNSQGDQVEEFELQFIDGELIDAELAKTLGVNQSNLGKYFELVEEWDEEDKIRFILAVGECGLSFDIETDKIDDLDIDIYEENNFRDLAISFVDEGYFGAIPKPLENYIDYSAIARDLAIDYSESIIAGTSYIYRAG